MLLVEDNPVDAELIVRSLRDAGFNPAVRRVQTEAEYLAALAEAPDLILSDFGLPSFNGFEALELLRNRGLDTPFILISGTLGEELIVKAIKRGADDYLMKDHLVRLGPAVEQVLRAKSLRDEAKRAALERQRMVDTHAAVLDALPAHIALLDERGVIVTVNETWRRFAAENGGQPDRDGVGRNYLEVCERAVGGSAEGARAVADGIRAVLRGELAEFSHEYPCHSPGESRWFRLIVSPQSQNRSGGAVVTHVNITARKRAEDTLQASHREYEQHHAALLQLARSPALQGSAEAAALAEITSTLAQAMKAARVSFWSFAPDRSAIVCRDLFHAPTAGHAAGHVLRAADFPGYFQALAANDILAADDARSDPRTREFTATYLEPEGIASMLDAPVLVGGVLEGVLCVEHVGPVRRWTVSECNLAMAVSSLVAQFLARSAQARSEAQLRAILDNEPECVMTVGSDGRLLEMNPAGLRMIEAGERATVVGRPFVDLVHPEDREGFLALHRRVSAGENGRLQFRIRSLLGTERWMDTHATPLTGAQGTIDAVLSVTRDITEQRRFESVRRESEERTRMLALRLQRTLESITDAFFTVDRAWRFSYLNPAAERMLGRSADSLLGREIWQEFPASIGTEFERNYRRAARDNVAAHFQEFYPAPLNAWYDVRAYPSDEGLAVYFQDVTVQRRQQQALLESEERFRLLANATNDAIWDWDLATDALWWNEGFETLFGFSRAEVEPTVVSWTSRVHPADHDAVVADLQRAIETGDVFWSSEYRFRRKDGSYAFVLDRGHILRDAAGRGTRMIGGMTDLTERRKIEERLREQASLLDAAQDAIFVRDPEHRLIYCNHSAERLYGWKAAEMIGQSCRELLHADVAQFDAAVQKLLADGKWSGQLLQRKRDGGTIEVEGRWTLMRDAANQPKSVLVVNTDITERKKLEQQFLRAQRLESIGTLAGGIAHDLNNLLAPITMGVQLLRHFEPRAESKPIIDNIERAAGRGASLVKQVLSFARGVEGARVAVQVRHIVREVESILANTFPKSIRVTSSLPSGLWLVTGDPTQLNQTLLNLCVNARDAMPHGGTLTLAAENIEIDALYAIMNRDAAPGRYVVLSVTDTGTGIPREILDRIFDPFFTTKDVGQGTGLGLSTVLGIVRSHGGFVNVHSEVGKGSTFRVHLPVQKGGDEADEADVGGGETLPRGNGELVLVVDDEAPILEVTKQTLEAFGYRVIIAEDGAQAVGQFALARAEIAVVLTDMMMPVMDGPALISALRHIDPRVRILAASGLNAGEDVAKASSLGVKHFLAKPFSASTLLDALHRVLTENGKRRPQ